MRRVTELLVPQGSLVVEQVFQELLGNDGEVVALWETWRVPHLNGKPIWWRPDTRDLLAAASDALSLLPLPVPLVGAAA
jgi:hypothetical protein